MSGFSSTVSRPAPAPLFAALSAELPLAGEPAQSSMYGAPGLSRVAPDSFRLLPYGRFRSADGSGRPVDVPAGWFLDLPAAQRIVDAAQARAGQMVLDYEHQTLLAADNGQPAPAAGWVGRLEARADGLYAVDVTWTERAAAMIVAREYRYVSPVFQYDRPTGTVLSLAHVALTNDPGLDGLTDLAALKSLGAAAAAALLPAPNVFTKEKPMKELLTALGLTETATEAEALSALAALKNTHGTELAALKAAAPDPARFVATATLSAVQGQLAATNAELAALKAQVAEDEVDKVVSAALDAGQLIPATENWARELGKSDLAALKAFVAAAPVVVAPGQSQSGGAAGMGAGAGATGTPGTATGEELAVMKALGLDAGQFALGKRTEMGV